MSVRLYIDVHVRRPVTTALRLRGVDVLTAQDDDLLQEATARQRRGVPFAGVIYAHQQNITVRRTIDDLELIAKACDLEQLENRVVFLPLK